MNSTSFTAAQAVELVLDQARGLRCYLTGSAASAADKERAGIVGFEKSWHDVDLFVGSDLQWVRSIQYLIDHGYEFGDERMEMIWRRVLNFGTKGWQTHSMRLTSPEGIEVNVIYKTVNRAPTDSLSKVLESFDFGLLALGWETEDGTFRDMREYMFGSGIDLHAPLPLLPWRREQIQQGHFREHQGLRMFGRAARYFGDYGYDGSLVVPVMSEGYFNAAQYYQNRSKPEDLVLGNIYAHVALLLDDGDWAQLAESSAALPGMDTLDELYQKLIEP